MVSWVCPVPTSARSAHHPPPLLPTPAGAHGVCAPQITRGGPCASLRARERRDHQPGVGAARCAPCCAAAPGGREPPPVPSAAPVPVAGRRPGAETFFLLVSVQKSEGLECPLSSRSLSRGGALLLGDGPAGPKALSVCLSGSVSLCKWGGTEADRAMSVPKCSPSDSETGPPGPCGVCTPLPVSQLSGCLGVAGWGASSPYNVLCDAHPRGTEVCPGGGLSSWALVFLTLESSAGPQTPFTRAPGLPASRPLSLERRLHEVTVSGALAGNSSACEHRLWAASS